MTYEEEPGLARAEQLFAEAGAPTTKRAVFELLEKILTKCKREGVTYPRIILRRRIEMRKGLWTPRRSSARAQINSHTPPSQSSPPAGATATVDGARQMVADLRRHNAAPEEIQWWEGEVKRREAAATGG